MSLLPQQNYKNYLVTFVLRNDREPSYQVCDLTDLFNLLRCDNVHITDVFFCGTLVAHFSCTHNKLFYFTQAYINDNDIVRSEIVAFKNILNLYAELHGVSFVTRGYWAKGV